MKRPFHATLAFWSLLATACLWGAAGACHGQDAYERPVNSAPQAKDIGADYVAPPVQRVDPRSARLALLDVLLLAAALGATGWSVHRARKRGILAAISLASLAYFGFYRQGCVCPVGSVQNVATALVDPQLAVPVSTLTIFLLPLFAALWAGRVFCGGPCPLGAIQDFVLLRPRQLPLAVDRWGGALKYVYLAAALWWAVQPVASRDWLICRFDPFVGIFRLSGTALMFSAGGLLLLLGTVVGRPYCRFLCPYGGLLALVSRFAWRPVRITPDTELDCGLCAEACPFGAIRHLRADKGACLACARCFAHCPRQQLQWGQIELTQLDPPMATERIATRTFAHLPAKEPGS